jgi:DNA modification methylase
LEGAILMNDDEYISAKEIFKFIEEIRNKNFLVRAIDCIQIKEDGIYSPIEWIAYLPNMYDKSWEDNYANQNSFINFINEALKHDPNFYFEVFFETKEEFEAQRMAELLLKEKSKPFYKKVWRAISS